MVQMLKSHVFFHLMTEAYLIPSVQKVLQVVNHGALLRLMREDTTWMANGEIVLAALSVEQVKVRYSRKNVRIFSIDQKMCRVLS